MADLDRYFLIKNARETRNVAAHGGVVELSPLLGLLTWLGASATVVAETERASKKSGERPSQHFAGVQPELFKYLRERVAEALRTAFSAAFAAATAAGASPRCVCFLGTPTFRYLLHASLVAAASLSDSAGVHRCQCFPRRPFPLCSAVSRCP